MVALQYLEFFFKSVFLFFQTLIDLIRSKKPKTIKNQLALITGGANGIGKAIALNLAYHGCNIAIADIDMNAAEKTIQELKTIGVKAKAFKVDIGNLDEVEQLKIEIENKLGPVDILVNNAGIHIAGHVTEEEPSRLLQMLNTNLVSHIWVGLTSFDSIFSSL